MYVENGPSGLVLCSPSHITLVVYLRSLLHLYKVHFPLFLKPSTNRGLPYVLVITTHTFSYNLCKNDHAFMT